MTLASPLQFCLDDWGQLVEQKWGKCIQWSYMQYLIFISSLCLPKKGQYTIHLGRKKNQQMGILTLAIGLFSCGKRSPYSPLIVLSTSLHLAASNGVGVLKDKVLEIIFSFFSFTRFLTCTEIFSQCHPFFSFLPCFFL
jgi:hypothetical protein